jgi:hypothetical protein
MCVCAESLEVEVIIRHQLVVQWLECLLTMSEDSGSIPGISDHQFPIITFSSLKSNVN